MGLIIDLEDLVDTNAELVEAIIENTGRYQNIFADAIAELLPQYKEKDVRSDICWLFSSNWPLCPQRFSCVH